MAKTHLDIVSSVLQEYADRGVFGGMSRATLRKGVTAFEFKWLYNRRYTIVFDEKNASLRFKNCFAALDSKSEEYEALKEFVTSKYDKSLPAHRRIDKGRAEASCTSRGGGISLVLKVNRNQYKYGVGQLVNLLHESFLMLDRCYSEYLYEHYDLPEE